MDILEPYHEARGMAIGHLQARWKKDKSQDIRMSLARLRAMRHGAAHCVVRDVTCYAPYGYGRWPIANLMGKGLLGLWHKS